MKRKLIVCMRNISLRFTTKKVILNTFLLLMLCVPQMTNAQDTVTTKSGLIYSDQTIGNGAEAKAGQNVAVHYTGWLYENGSKGKKFDSSVDRNQVFSFPLGAGRVISGWDEGVQGMKVGGQRTLIIPSNLAYGPSGAGGVIPPNATLLFEIELIEIR